MLYTIVLHVMAYLWVIHGQLNITEKVRIAEMLLEICPRTSVCRNNVTIINQDHSCCAECSCEADCGLDVPCCYKDDRDKYRARVRAECLLPKSRQIGGKYQPMYYMVGDVDKKYRRCEYTYVAPWGSMYPVVSKSTGLIYINAICAEKNNVTDFQLLQAHVVCTPEATYDESSRSIAGYADWPNGCVVYFNVDTEVFAGQKCGLKDMISKCLINFEVPSYTNLSRNQIMEGCASGLLSPYYKGQGYVNPFCMICNSYTETSQCTELDDTLFSRRLDVLIYYLLDITPIAKRNWALYVPTQKDAYNMVKACLPATKHGDRNETVCREVRCPSGQVRNTKDGKCFFPAKIWYTYGFAVYLKLIPTESIFVTDTIEIGKLKSPWPISWYISKIFGKLVPDNSSNYEAYEPGNSSDYEAYDYGTGNRTIVNHFIVRLNTNQRHINPNTFLETVEMNIDSNWIYMTDSGPVELQSSLSIYSRWQQVLSTNVVIPKMFSKTFNQYYAEHWVLAIIYDAESIEQSKTSSSVTVLSRLHFCERMQLLPHEFDLPSLPGLSEGGILHHIYQDALLMDGEYTLSYASNGERRAYICLSDSSFVKNEDYDNVASRRSNNNVESVTMVLFVMSVNFNHI